MNMGRQLNCEFMKSMKNIRVLHTIAALRSASGGPSRTVSSICEGLGRLGASVEIVTQNFRDANIVPQSEFVKTTFVPGIFIPSIRFVYSPFFRTTLSDRCKKTEPRLIHDHGLWLPTNHAAAVIAHNLNIPLIISPRGMLEPWSLRNKAWKKRIAWNLYQHRALLSGIAFHAASVKEAESIREMGFKQPIAVIPNGTQFSEWKEYLRKETDLRTALFLSRIHRSKGLLELVKAWQIAHPKGWRMIIAGPDEDGHQKEVQAAIHQAGLQDIFQFAGSVEGEAKTNLYRSADLFILPTFSENFGVVVAEALSCGVPVITTKGAPWESLITYGCGWWIDIGVESLSAAIREATSLSEIERQEMGRRGCIFVEQNFAWSQIAEKMLSVYQWILGEGSKPNVVL